jgi:hypothetical protein
MEEVLTMTDHKEEIAKIIYKSLDFVLSEPPLNLPIPKWEEGGNSHAQVECRKRASEILMFVNDVRAKDGESKL